IQQPAVRGAAGGLNAFWRWRPARPDLTDNGRAGGVNAPPAPQDGYTTERATDLPDCKGGPTGFPRSLSVTTRYVRPDVFGVGVKRRPLTAALRALRVPVRVTVVVPLPVTDAKPAVVASVAVPRATVRVRLRMSTAGLTSGSPRTMALPWADEK